VGRGRPGARAGGGRTTIRVAFFGTKRYDRGPFEAANARHGHDLHFLEPRLGPQTVRLAGGHPAVCVFRVCPPRRRRRSSREIPGSGGSVTRDSGWPLAYTSSGATHTATLTVASSFLVRSSAPRY
jgi:hypothetical protein